MTFKAQDSYTYCASDPPPAPSTHPNPATHTNSHPLHALLATNPRRNPNLAGYMHFQQVADCKAAESFYKAPLTLTLTLTPTPTLTLTLTLTITITLTLTLTLALTFTLTPTPTLTLTFYQAPPGLPYSCDDNSGVSSNLNPNSNPNPNPDPDPDPKPKPNPTPNPKPNPNPNSNQVSGNDLADFSQIGAVSSK